MTHVLASKDSTVEIKVEFEGHKTKWLESGLEVIALIGQIKILCRLRVNDLRVTVSTPRPITCNTESVYVGDIVGRHTFPLEFYVANLATPSDLQCDIYVFYVSDNGSPHFVQKSGVKIPLFVVAKPSESLEKEAECKLTFSVNKPSVNLVQLYNDFEWTPEANATSICFKFYDGVKVTVLSSTKTNSTTASKYRIQSNIIAAIYIVYRDFLDRLQRKFGREKSGFQVEVASAPNEVPFLMEYFSEMDAHMLRKEREVQIKADLADRAAQLRAVQRRLLIRFRDKNPVPLTQLETLLDGSLDQIGDCINFIETNEDEMYKSECRLSGCTRLLIELMVMKGGTSPEEAAQISSSLCPYIWNYTEEFGWEEAVYSALTFIKSQVITTQTGQLDTKKLKKAIKAVLEKVGKGGIAPDALGNVSKKPEPEKKQEAETLVGNDLQERMTSARGRRTRPHNPVLEPIPEPVEVEEPPLTEKQPQHEPSSPEESNLVALRDSYENEITEIRSEGRHLLLQNDDDEDAEEDLEAPFNQNHLDERMQKETKLLKEADEPQPSSDVISDENFW
ncbi:unnamed protein product [Orchesella dallaii]|uniref:Protein PTHB1 n=1 Tax=Orchesella dallaii TaxID=48710 RepID=A0ABP1PPB5_9HEXA